MSDHARQITPKPYVVITPLSWSVTICKAPDETISTISLPLPSWLFAKT